MFLYKGWNSTTKSFLKLLKLLPPTAKGPLSKQKTVPNFEKAVEKLIRFEEV